MYMEKYKQGVRVNSLLKIKTDFSKLKAFADHRLTLSQTTNFTLFQIERVSRRQF